MSSTYQTRYPGQPAPVTNRSLVTSIQAADMGRLAVFLASGRCLSTPHWWHDPGELTSSVIDDPYYKHGAVWIPAGATGLAVGALYGGAEWQIEWSADGSTWSTLKTVFPEMDTGPEKEECSLVFTAPWTSTEPIEDGQYHYPLDPPQSSPRLLHWRATLPVLTTTGPNYIVSTYLWAVFIEPVFAENLDIT